MEKLVELTIILVTSIDEKKMTYNNNHLAIQMRYTYIYFFRKY